MQTRMNSWMREYLERPEMRGYLENTKLSPEVAAIVESPILELGGCYLLEALLPDGFDLDYALAHHRDCTDLEWDVNSFLRIPLDIVPVSELDPLRVLAEGYIAVRRLAERLKDQGHFLVTLGFQNDEYIESHVAFYKDRPDEYKYVDDLELYEGQPILIIDT